MFCKQLQLQESILITNNLHNVKWFQVFLSNMIKFQCSECPSDMIVTRINTPGPNGDYMIATPEVGKE